MKKRQLLLASVAVLSLLAANTNAQVTSQNILGYVNFTFQPGDNWFGNPLDFHPDPTSGYANDNALSNLIPSAPVGTTVSLWNSTSDSFGPASTWNGSQWSTDLTLNPGTGALLDTPTLFTNTFVGQVLNLDGSIANLANLLTNGPPPFAGPNGAYLLSSMAPIALSGDVFSPTNNEFSVFESIIGRAPQNGEQVTILDLLTQSTTTSTFSGSAWDIDPVLGIGEAALFNLGPVPEPSCVGLLLVGLGTLNFTRRRSQR